MKPDSVPLRGLVQATKQIGLTGRFYQYTVDFIPIKTYMKRVTGYHTKLYIQYNRSLVLIATI